MKEDLLEVIQTKWKKILVKRTGLENYFFYSLITVMKKEIDIK